MWIIMNYIYTRNQMFHISKNSVFCAEITNWFCAEITKDFYKNEKTTQYHELQFVIAFDVNTKQVFKYLLNY